MTDYSENNYKAAIEAILFTMGKSVQIDQLTAALEISEEELEDYVSALAEGYQAEDRGIRIIRLEDAYQLCTKAEYFDALVRIAKHPVKPSLTETVLEVLSVIAYKQPVTKGEIERIRGVSCDYAVNRLVEYGLVEENGRLNAPGRPILFKTTEEFLRLFGISSPSDLPPLTEETMEKAKIRAYRAAKQEGMEVSESDFLDDTFEGQVEITDILREMTPEELSDPEEEDAFGNAIPEGEDPDDGPVIVET